MTPEEIVKSLTRHIRDAVRPHLGEWRSRRVSGTAASGDATFAIDDIAEEAIVSFIERHHLSIAYYSEDKGLIEFGTSPESVLIIDPIDGTRPAIAGFEACVVSVALADYTPNVTMGHVQCGCIQEIKNGDLFYATRGAGAHWYDVAGGEKDPRLLPITDLTTAPLSFEAVARPFEWLGPALSEIVNASSVKGGCFLFNSTAFSLTRLVTGQLAASFDIGNRIFRDYPEGRARFRELGLGKSLGLFTYDLAAAALIAAEAGAVVTDAYGNSFDSTPLLDTSEENLKSVLAASTPELHEKLLRSMDEGIRRLEPLMRA